MNGDRLQFLSLYFVRFSGGFGLAALVTLLPTYISLYDPSGLVIGLYTSAFTLASTVAIVPFAWGGDAGDKRRVLAVAVALALVSYVGFAFVTGSWGFVAARSVQGFAATGASLMSLSLVGELAPTGERANHIGKANAARLASGIVGSLSVGAIYEIYGFRAVYGLLVALLALALVALVAFVRPDPVRIEGFPFSSLSVNERLRTLSTFRGQYAVAVTLVRTWVPIYAGVEAAQGGLAYGSFAVAVVITAEKAANMAFQPYTGRLSDRFGRAAFVAAGGAGYGLVALAVPFAPGIGTALGLPPGVPGAAALADTALVRVVGVSEAVAGLATLTPAFLPLVGANALLGATDAFREPASMALFADEGENTEGGGVASSFGIREFVWRPGSVAAPFLGGWLMTEVGMAWVFYAGGAAALSAVVVFLAVLAAQHGPAALRTW
ncbi:MFS transporter [Halosegnis marinus]|uniref:MFS transporter n=1 Tax=Halosegnis marinus TaxID=3034023 RepID=A0ABD5ZP85_9EURY|nr:MFS transporter [Halosegnis sp. DT85]